MKNKKEKKQKSLLRNIIEWVATILAALLIALVIRSFVFELVRVDGHSMDNTLADGEIMLVTKYDYSSTWLCLPWQDSAAKESAARFKAVIHHFVRVNQKDTFHIFHRVRFHLDVDQRADDRSHTSQRQDIVDALGCAFQRLLCVVHRLLAQGFVGDVEHRAQCHSQQQRQSTENQPISFNKLFHYDVSVVDKESR